MNFKVFKNKNIHLHTDVLDDPPFASMNELIDTLANDPDSPGIFKVEVGYAGNEYAYYSVSFWIDGIPHDYQIDTDDLDRLNSGHRVILESHGWTPVFTLPYWWHSTPLVRKDGTTGIGYHLDAMPDDPETYTEWGCEFITSKYRYAPEMRHPVLFVPDGFGYYFG